jgi:hypothetical protein
MLNPTAAAKLSASELLASSDTQLAAALQLLGYK